MRRRRVALAGCRLLVPGRGARSSYRGTDLVGGVTAPSRSVPSRLAQAASQRVMTCGLPSCRWTVGRPCSIRTDHPFLWMNVWCRRHNKAPLSTLVFPPSCQCSQWVDIAPTRWSITSWEDAPPVSVGDGSADAAAIGPLGEVDLADLLLRRCRLVGAVAPRPACGPEGVGVELERLADQRRLVPGGELGCWRSLRHGAHPSAVRLVEPSDI
jgi:hypothetical protein